MPPLSREDVASRLSGTGGWKLRGDEITKEFKFADFAGSMSFVNSVAAEAEAADHHPDITINYNKVTLTLSTHSEGGLTDKDFVLAGKINAIA